MTLSSYIYSTRSVPYPYGWSNSFSMRSEPQPPSHPLILWGNYPTSTFSNTIENIARKHRVSGTLRSSISIVTFGILSLPRLMETPSLLSLGLLEEINKDIYEVVAIICAHFKVNYEDTITFLDEHRIRVKFKFYTPENKDKPVIAHYSNEDLRSPFNYSPLRMSDIIA